MSAVEAVRPALDELAREFGPRGVAFVGVDPNAQDSLGDVAAFVRLQNITFPIFKDIDGSVADRMGAVRTPEVFVLDAERFVCYRGRIDDQYGVGVRRPADAAPPGRRARRAARRQAGVAAGRRGRRLPHRPRAVAAGGSR